MQKIVALAAVKQDAFGLAWESAKNSCRFFVDLMYGTPERTRITYAFACALLVLGYSLSLNSANILPVCTM